MIQLNVDLEAMPIEDAMASWSEDASPYRTVARLALPVQDAYDAARERYVDGRLSFNPAHALLAHRPLGSINRARLVACTALADIRRTENGEPLTSRRPSLECRRDVPMPIMRVEKALAGIDKLYFLNAVMPDERSRRSVVSRRGKTSPSSASNRSPRGVRSYESRERTSSSSPSATRS